MHRGEGEPYNPYPEERGSPRGEHHHHHFGHYRPEEGPQYGSNLEHRPPPPPRPDYGAPAPQGYGEGPYGQERRPGPYEEQRHGGYEEQRHGGYEEQRHGGFEERKNSSEYPPGPNPYGSSANPASGHSYGDESYHTSPYAPAPSRHGPITEGGGAPRRRQIPGLPVRVHCKADPNFSLAVVPGQGPVMVPTDPRDDYQVWYKDETMSTRVTDETGASSFFLVNKATGEALRHPPEDLKQCLLAEYEPNGRDESVLWTMSEDMGQGYRCIRLATKISRNLDVLRGDKKSGGVKEGSPAITFAWKKQDNQIWKMTPA